MRKCILNAIYFGLLLTSAQAFAGDGFSINYEQLDEVRAVNKAYVYTPKFVLLNSQYDGQQVFNVGLTDEGGQFVCEELGYKALSYVDRENGGIAFEGKNFLVVKKEEGQERQLDFMLVNKDSSSYFFKVVCTIK